MNRFFSFILCCGAVACGGASGTTALAGGGTTTNDGGPGGNPQVVSCGTSTCSIPAQACCVFETTPAWTYGCVDGTTCPVLAGGPNGAGVQGTALGCSGAANCTGGDVCCVFENANKQVVSACQATCPAGGAQLCDPTAASSGCAADAGACSSANISDWGLPKGYATCGGVGS
ncbi:MAG TPA: hypothetical protein VLM85_01180 [Polyangiaceae bacterium]|nr:hypothetical protein [Polyangiaceae bacterium]